MQIKQELFLMQQTCATLFSLTNKLQAFCDRSLGELTVRQLMALTALAHLPGEEATLNRIASKLAISKQGAKLLMDALERKGFVTMAPSATDRRAVNVRFTEAGKIAALRVSEQGIYLLADVFSNFSAGELETLWNLLKKLYRFDGTVQDGFEAEGSVEMPGVDLEALQKRVLEEFARRRQHRKEGNSNEEK